MQKLMFVIDCWREITQPQIHLNAGELTKMYSDLKPTPKKVAAIFSYRDDIQAGRGGTAPEKMC